MKEQIANHVADVVRGLKGLLSLCEDPDRVSFDDLRASFEVLEGAMGHKAYLDLVFAWICERDNAGLEFGSPYASEYLVNALGLSKSEAFSRLNRAKDLFAPVPPPPPPPPPPPGDEDAEPDTDTDNDSGAGDQDGFDLGDAQRRAEEDAQRKANARNNAKHLSDERLKIIERALKNLTTAAQCERADILEKATAEAAVRPPEDLRKFVERLVRNANRKHSTPDPNAGWDLRGVTLRDDQSAGVCDIHIRTTLGFGALLKAQLDLGLPANRNLPNEEELRAAGAVDPRTPGQRRHDEFIKILQNWESNLQHERKGAASLVVAMTMDDLADADRNSTFQTNTGIALPPTELVRLGLCGEDFIVQLDRVTGLPMSLGRTRIADFHQRIALLALQGVCAWEGCDRPMSELEVHHILPYVRGGDTSLENLIGLCRTHHRQNNDFHDGRDGRRHVERCPETGEVGVQYCDGSPLHINQTQGHTDSGGYKIRRRERAVPRHAPPDPVLFPEQPDGPPF